MAREGTSSVRRMRALAASGLAWIAWGGSLATGWSSPRRDPRAMSPPAPAGILDLLALHGAGLPEAPSASARTLRRISPAPGRYGLLLLHADFTYHDPLTDAGESMGDREARRRPRARPLR